MTSRNKSLNILRTKRVFKNEIKRIFHNFWKALNRANNTIFLEGESPNLRPKIKTPVNSTRFSWSPLEIPLTCYFLNTAGNSISWNSIYWQEIFLLTLSDPLLHCLWTNSSNKTRGHFKHDVALFFSIFVWFCTFTCTAWLFFYSLFSSYAKKKGWLQNEHKKLQENVSWYFWTPACTHKNVKPQKR